MCDGKYYITWYTVFTQTKVNVHDNPPAYFTQMIGYYSHCSTPCFLIICQVLSSGRQRQLIHAKLLYSKYLKTWDIRKRKKYRV